MKEAIILAGGEGKRLRPCTDISKPLLELDGETLVDFQLRWLRSHGFGTVIIPSKEPIPTSYPAVHVEEKERLGTGGAIKLALSRVKGERVYVMNVDDICFYDPASLIREAYPGGAILVARPVSGFGRVKFGDADNIIKFEEKPLLPWYCSIGHYAFQKEILERYLPDKGNVELQTFPNMADKKLLKVLVYTGIWITINTIKDLEEARKALDKIEQRSIPKNRS